MAPERARRDDEDNAEARVREVAELMIILGLEFEGDEDLSPHSPMARIKSREINDLLTALSPEDQALAQALAAKELPEEIADARRVREKQPGARALRAIPRLEEALGINRGSDKFSRAQLAAAAEFQRELSDRLTEDPEIKAQYEELCRSLGIDPADRDELWERSRSIIKPTNEQEE